MAKNITLTQKDILEAASSYFYSKLGDLAQELERQVEVHGTENPYTRARYDIMWEKVLKVNELLENEERR